MLPEAREVVFLGMDSEEDKKWEAGNASYLSPHGWSLYLQDALAPEELIDYARQLGLDVDRFTEELENHAGAARIAEDVDGADLSNVSGTPTFFINGRRHYGSYDITALTAAVRAAKAAAATPQSGTSRPA